MADIPQPETIVLPHLFKSQQKHIAAPFALEEVSVQVSPPTQPGFCSGYLAKLQCLPGACHFCGLCGASSRFFVHFAAVTISDSDWQKKN